MEYANQVLEGKVLASKWVSLACQRHLDDLKDGGQRGLVFDGARADRIVTYIERYCRHFEGEWAGKLIQLELWQKFCYGVAYGWVDEATGFRRFRESYKEVPRKNGKTLTAAGEGLYLTQADGLVESDGVFRPEGGAKVYSAATKKQQAKIMFDGARLMVKNSPALRSRLGVYIANIHDLATASSFEPLGSDSDKQDGLNVHGGLLDELHQHKTRGMYDVIRTASGARRQPMLSSITTAGLYKPESIGWELHTMAKKVLEGSMTNDRFFAYIATIDEGDPWDAEKSWIKANPNWNVSVKPENILEAYERALVSVGAKSSFMRYHLNVWVNSVDRWIEMERWARCGTRELGRNDLEELRGRPCFGALDLARKKDLSALILYFPPLEDEEPARVLSYFWAPEQQIVERSNVDRVPYVEWSRSGAIVSTPSATTDFAFIRESIIEIIGQFAVQSISYDRAYADQLVLELQQEAIEMVPHGQGFEAMTGPMEELGRQVYAGEIAHGDNPVLTWMASNVVVRQSPDEKIRPDKGRSAEKIDGIVALIMAIGAWMRAEAQGSVYDEREPVLV